MSTGPDVTATFCATLADEWVRSGVTDVVVCPGSRSTPLSLAVAEAAGFTVHVHHDERSGGFMALGIGLATGRPAVIVTTSGTAVAELHAAVVEANQARVPLIVVSTDRPPELQDIGAPQTIDQTHIFGGSVRWFAEPGVPDDVTASIWRSLAARSVAVASNPIPGPVHLNLAFREPLVGNPGALPVGRADGRPMTVVDARERTLGDDGLVEMRRLTEADRGVIVVGESGAEQGVAEMVHRMAEAVGWPVIADPRSGCRIPNRTTIAAADAILREDATASRLQPEVILRVGALPASKVVNAWLDASDATQVLVHPLGSWIDPGHRVSRILDLAPTVVASIGMTYGSVSDPAWLDSWIAAESAAQAAIEEVLADHPEPTEPGIARSVMAALPLGANLVASSSMPIRDVEWYGLPIDGVRVWANRGANGIDGVTSTAVGVALGSKDLTALLIGDVAFLHDTNGLLGLAGRGVDLTIVVVDNDGGGIFSFLPQRRELERERFEQLFGTPHGVDLIQLCGAHGIEVIGLSTAVEVGPSVAASMATGGVRVIRVRTDRDENVAVHDEIHAAVAAKLLDLV